MKTTGREYALALFETAYESGNIDDVRNNIRSLKRLLKEMPDYIEFLSNPGIPKSERMEALSEAFEGKVDDVLYSFLAVMTERSDMGSFFDAYKEFEHMYEDFKKFTYAEITSAVELTDEEKAKTAEEKARADEAERKVAELQAIIEGMKKVEDMKKSKA